MGKKIAFSTGLVILIVIAINFLSQELYLRLDLTEDKEYTLSKATRDVLNDLEDVVTVKAYFTETLPPELDRIRQEFRDRLIEYANRSDGNVAYEFINPNKDEATQQAAMQSGIQAVNVNMRDKDEIKQQRAFMGALLSYHGNQEVIPFIKPGAGMEYALTTAIKKLSIAKKSVVGIAQGHGESPLDQLSELQKSLENLYTVKEIIISDTTTIPGALNTLVIMAPTQTFTPSQLKQLDDFLQRDGRIYFGLNVVDVDLQRAMGNANITGLEAWLKEKGLLLNQDLVIDIQCGAINVQQQMAFGMITQQVQFPYLPNINRFTDHPASKGLESVLFKFVSSIRYEGDSTKKFIPLAITSEKSGTYPVPVQLNYQKQWTQEDFPQQGIVIAGVLQGKLSGSTRSKIIVVGDGDFAVSGPREEMQRLNPDNLNFITNCIDWLSDDTGLIELRTKGATLRPIKALDDSKKLLLKYLNFLLPLLLVIGYGVYNSQRNKIKRFKWMSENYEKD